MRLYTIPISHFCEKARWALDMTGLAYTEERHLQVFHWRPVKRAGGGRTVPVLTTGDRVLAESHDILEFADGHIEQSLFPTDEAAKLEAEYDAYGVETRRLIYQHLLKAPKLVYAYNNIGAPLWERAALRVGFRFVRNKMTKALDVNDQTIAAARDIIARTLDDVAERLGDGRRYLLGDAFSAADLTFACMSAAIVAPREYGVPLPPVDEMPADTAQMISAYREHPAGAFALRLFREDRPPPARLR